MTAVLTPLLLTLGPAAVLLLMGVVFAETGLMLGFFLPGDSLLFTAGVMVAGHALALPLWLVMSAVAAAAVAGDQFGFLLGRRFGPRLLSHPRSRWRSPHRAEQAQRFFDRHGAKAVVLARFVPVARTLTPAVAGVGRMSRVRFTTYNAVGGVGWVALMMAAGFWLGGVAVVADHVELVAVGLVVLSVVPASVGWIHSRVLRRSHTAPTEGVAQMVSTCADPGGLSRQ